MFVTYIIYVLTRRCQIVIFLKVNSVIRSKKSELLLNMTNLVKLRELLEIKLDEVV